MKNSKGVNNNNNKNNNNNNNNNLKEATPQEATISEIKKKQKQETSKVTLK